MMNRARVIGLALVTALMLAPAASATIILQEDFDGFGSPLDGQTVSTVGTAVWEAGDTFFDDGTAATTVASSADGQAAHLDFLPKNNKIYTLSTRYLNNQSNWLAVGFMPADPPAPNTWQSTNFAVRHSNNGAYAWMLSRNNSTQSDQQAFNGVNTSNGRAPNGDVADPTQFIEAEIILNTYAPIWTLDIVVNGTSYGVTNLPAGANDGLGTDDIRGIGFSHERSATANGGAVLDYLILDCVPEPSSIALVVIGLCGLAALGRKRH